MVEIIEMSERQKEVSTHLIKIWSVELLTKRQMELLMSSRPWEYSAEVLEELQAIEDNIYEIINNITNRLENILAGNLT